MDDKIKALINIYTELKLAFAQISKSDKVDNKEKQELANLLKDLQKRALDAGVDINNLKEGKIDNVEDWRELVAVSKIDYKLQILLVKKIDSLQLNPSSTQMWEVIKALDNFYSMSVVNAGKNLSDQHKKGASSESVLREFGQQAAIAAIQDNIDKLDSKLTLSHDALKKDYASYFSKEKKIPSSAVYELENTDSGIDETQDTWQAIVKESQADERIKSALFTKISKSKTNPDAKVILDLVNLLDEYYISNVSELKDTTIEKRLKIDLSALSDEQKHLKQEHYRKSAFAALLDAIEQLDSNTWALNPEKDIHPIFVEYYDKKKELPITGDFPIPHQWKLDMIEIPVPPFKGGQLPVKLQVTNGKIQLSAKIAYLKKTHCIKTPETKIFENFGKKYEQFVRNTLSVSLISKSFNIGSTLYSNGMILAQGSWGNIVLKTELGKVDWLALVKKNPNAKLFTLAPIIVCQLNINIPHFWERDEFSHITDSIVIHKAELTASIGFVMNVELFNIKQEVERRKKVKTTQQKAKIDLSNDTEFNKKLAQKGDALNDKAKKIKAIQENFEAKKIKVSDFKKKLKPEVESFKKIAFELQDEFEARKWKTSNGKEAGQKLMQKIGKEAIEEIGEEGLKTFLRFTAKATPVIGQILAIVDLAFFLWSAYESIQEHAPQIPKDQKKYKSTSGVYGKSSPNYNIPKKKK